MSVERRGLKGLRLPRHVADALEGFISRAARELGDVEVYLFGSYARGDWLRDSDLDLIVVSRRFKGMDVGERYRVVRSLLPDSISVEILAYTPEEFRRARERSVIIRDAAEYWIRLA